GVRAGRARAPLAPDQGLLEVLPVLALRSERDATIRTDLKTQQEEDPMTMKTLLGTAALALVVGTGSALAQSAIKIGHLADYSGGTSDVGTPYGQAVADTFAWINKNGGINGTK